MHLYLMTDPQTATNVQHILQIQHTYIPNAQNLQFPILLEPQIFLIDTVEADIQ